MQIYNNQENTDYLSLWHTHTSLGLNKSDVPLLRYRGQRQADWAQTHNHTYQHANPITHTHTQTHTLLLTTSWPGSPPFTQPNTLQSTFPTRGHLCQGLLHGGNSIAWGGWHAGGRSGGHRGHWGGHAHFLLCLSLLLLFLGPCLKALITTQLPSSSTCWFTLDWRWANNVVTVGTSSLLCEEIYMVLQM